MKKILLSLLLIGAGFAAKAQVMQAKAQWVTISIPQLKCWECKDRLEKYLAKETGATSDAGIGKWNVYMNTGTIRIQYYPDRMTLDYLRTAIANAGFDADTVKANEDSYKMLPPICKRKEEGGGPQKGKPCNIPPEDRIK
jgi:periplasmic mercuric ion binding protein